VQCGLSSWVDDVTCHQVTISFFISWSTILTMLSETDLDIIYGTLTKLDLPLETILITLQTQFPNESRCLELNAALSILLRERVLLPKVCGVKVYNDDVR
jgi:hypothetical protein